MPIGVLSSYTFILSCYFILIYSMIVCLIQQDFVSLQVLEPAKPLNDAQMCGSFYFYTLTILSIP